MKFNLTGIPLVKTRIFQPQLLLVMKFTLLLLLTSYLQAGAHVHAQSITYSKRQASLEQVFRAIREQTGYEFLYNSPMIGKVKARDLKFDHTPVSKVLDELFRDQPLTYTMVGKTIVVRERNGEQTIASGAEVAPIKVQGTVVDSLSGKPLAGVTIQVKGGSTGTITDIQGNYSLEVPDDAVLEVSYLGYNKKDVSVNGRANVSISLAPSATGLNQLVVVGYGEQSKATLTGAVSTVSMESLKQAPVTNFSNTLAGKLPGVVTINGSGEPGEDNSTILIRGNHSLNNNAPLIVIDGVPNRGGDLGRLDPNDIDNISVLKDATASIYGSESANGVILITTKHGRKNMAPEVTLTLNQGFNQPTRVPDMADAPAYMTMLNEAELYHGRQPAFSKEDIQAYKDPNRDPWLYPNTNWFKAALKPLSPQTKGNLSVQGGTSRLTYFLSLGALTQEGYYKNSATRYNQFNFRSNIEDQVTKFLKLGFDLSGRKEDRNFPTVSAGQTFRMLIRGRPSDPAYFPNGLPGPDQEGGVQPVVTGTTQTGYHRNQQYYLSGDLKLDLTIPGLKGFDLQGRFSYNKEFQEIKDWQTPWTLYSFDKQDYINNGRKDPEQFLTPLKRGPTDPELTQTYYQQEKKLENLVANYKHSFGDHNIALMVGAEQQTFEDNTFNAFRRHFISTAIPELFCRQQRRLEQQRLGRSRRKGELLQPCQL